MALWLYGLTDQGTPQLLGPFESEDEAQDAGAELNGVRIVSASTREAALDRLRGRAGMQRRAEPAPPMMDDDEWHDDDDEF